MIFTILDCAYKIPYLAFLIEIVSISIFPQMHKNATNVLGTHSNTSRATEMLLTFLESSCKIAKFSLPDRNCISLFWDNRAQCQQHVLYIVYSGRKWNCGFIGDVRDKPFLYILLLLLPLSWLVPREYSLSQVWDELALSSARATDLLLHILLWTG